MDCKSQNPVTWFEIYVDDMERATKFYETIFEMKFIEMANPTEQPMQMRSFRPKWELTVRPALSSRWKV